MTDAASVLLEGPWEHRFVSANGARFHVALAGEGPLVLFLHGFPQFWWSWRAQLEGLAEAGWRAAAADLRGFGASDKPPHGYDSYTATADVAAIVRSLGEERAVIVGQGLGGWIAWCMAPLQPAVTRAVAALSMPHPIVLTHASKRKAAQRSASRYVLALQVPFRPERTLARDDRQIRRYLTGWAAPGGAFPNEADLGRYAAALALPFVAHSAAEYYRWIGRNQLRYDGPLFESRIGLIEVPVLQLQGGADRCVLAECTGGSERFVHAAYTSKQIDGAGHFLSEEAPAEVTDALVRWLRTLP